MISKVTKITIISSRKPTGSNINNDLQWLGAALGLFNLRDKDQSCFRIFIELIKNTKSKEGISSDELAYRLSLSRGTIVHHINKLIEAGIVVNEHNKYLLRVNNLSNLVEEIEKDFQRSIGDIKNMAKKIDMYLNL